MVTPINIDLISGVVSAGFTQKSKSASTFRIVNDVDIVGKLNQTINVYTDLLEDVSVRNMDPTVRGTYIWDHVSQEPVAIKLEDEIYAAVSIDGFENTSVVGADTIDDYTNTIINPLIRKLVKRVEDDATNVLLSGSVNHAATVTTTGATVEEKFDEVLGLIYDAYTDFDAKSIIDSENCFLAVSPSIGKILSTGKLADSSYSGSTDALKSAIIGEKYGFNVYVNPKFTGNEMVAYSEEAFAIVSQAPKKLLSAAYSERVSALTSNSEKALMDVLVSIVNLPDTLEDGIVVKTYFKVAVLDALRTYKTTVTFV